MLRHRAETLSEILIAGVQRDNSPRTDLFSSSFPAGERSFDCYQSTIPDGLSVPHVIVPRSGDLEDLFAAIATYYPDQSPLTALAYVVTPESVSAVMRERNPSPDNDRERHGRNRRAMIGAALGEAALAALGVPEGSGGLPSYSVIRRTLAFALARGYQLYGEQASTRQLASKWTRLRDITGLPHSQSTVQAVIRAHEVASGRMIQESTVVDRNVDFFRAIDGLVAGHDPDGDDLNKAIAALYPEAERFLHELSGVFDGRMRAFAQLVQTIQLYSRGREFDEIVVGYICNRILPSSFAHSGALVPLAQFFPAALVWYGYFSLLTKPAKTSSLSAGLVLKLERDLVEPFSLEQRPRCDISLDELDVLSRATMPAEAIKPTQQRALLVGLLPGVDVYTRFGSDADRSVERARRDAEMSTLHRRVTDLLQEALGLIGAPSANLGKKDYPAIVGRKDKKRVR
ncbi:MAG: hypothetical protein WCV99_01780 [Sterolibacterium sp.]|jgi:hypothetical protein